MRWLALAVLVVLVVLVVGSGCTDPLVVPSLVPDADLALAPDLAPPMPDLAPPFRGEVVRFGEVDALAGSFLTAPYDLDANEVIVPEAITVEALAFIATQGGGKVMLALYEGGPDHVAHHLLAYSAVTSIDGPGRYEVPITPVMLAPGSYFVAIDSPYDAMTFGVSIGGSSTDTGIACYGTAEPDKLPTSWAYPVCTVDYLANLYLVGRKVVEGPGTGPPSDPLAHGAVGKVGWTQRSAGSEVVPDTLAFPIFVDHDTHVDGFGWNAAVGGGYVRLGVFEDTGTSPGAFVAGDDLASLSTTGRNEVHILDRPIAAGHYWLALRGDGTGAIGAGTDSVRRCRPYQQRRVIDSWPGAFDRLGACVAGNALDVYLITRD